MATGIQTGMNRGTRSGMSRKASPQKFSTLDRLLAMWKGLPHILRMALIGALVLFSVGVAIVAVHSANNRYVDLYQTQLSEQDLPAVSLALDEMGVDHRVNETRDGILVPPASKAKAQAGLTLRHLPLHHIIQDGDAKVGDTSLEQKARRQRQLEAEITLALRAIDGINDARVKLGIPEKVYYFDKKDQVKARVLLSLKPNVVFDRDRTASIVNLVAFSVPSLNPERVTVVDTLGRDLTAQLPKDKLGRFAAGGTELEVRANEEARMTTKVQDVLDKILPGRSRVLVNLELDFSELERRRYTPGGAADQGVVEDSMQMVSEVLNRDSEEDGGAKGYDSTKKSVNYRYMENYFAMVSKSARVSRITASVCVDGCTDAELKAVGNLVKGALGIDETRGDAVYVEATPWDRAMPLPPADFEPLALDAADRELPSQSALLVLLMGQSALILGGLAVFFFQRTRGGQAAPDLTSQPHANGATGIVDHHLTKNGVRTPYNGATSVQKTELLAGFVKERPESVASLLRSTWLHNS